MTEPKPPTVEPEHPDFLRQWRIYHDAVQAARRGSTQVIEEEEPS